MLAPDRSDRRRGALEVLPVKVARQPLLQQVALGRAHIRQDVAAAHLRDIHSVLYRCGIVFWLTEGTALDAVREGCVIPSDTDTDIAIRSEDRPASPGSPRSAAPPTEGVRGLEASALPGERCAVAFVCRHHVRTTGRALHRHAERVYGQDWRTPKHRWKPSYQHFAGLELAATCILSGGRLLLVPKDCSPGSLRYTSASVMMNGAAAAGIRLRLDALRALRRRCRVSGKGVGKITLRTHHSLTTTEAIESGISSMAHTGSTEPYRTDVECEELRRCDSLCALSSEGISM